METQNIIYPETFDALIQIIESIHEVSPELTDNHKEYFAFRIAGLLGLNVRMQYVEGLEKEQ